MIIMISRFVKKVIYEKAYYIVDFCIAHSFKLQHPDAHAPRIQRNPRLRCRAMREILQEAAQGFLLMMIF